MEHAVRSFALLGALALFADVAPLPPRSSNSGGCACRDRVVDAPREDARLTLSISDCGCVTSPVSVAIDGEAAGILSCGSAPLVVPITTSDHRVAASGPDGTWPELRRTAAPGENAVVELGCPTVTSAPE